MTDSPTPADSARPAPPDEPPPAPAEGATLDALQAGARGTLVERVGIRLLEASADLVVGTMPVAGNTQPAGLLHGGASLVLAETLGSYGAMLHAGPDLQAVGLEISATHHRAARDGEVTGRAVALHRGRTTATYEIVVVDSMDRRVCTARLTCLLIAARRPD